MALSMVCFPIPILFHSNVCGTSCRLLKRWKVSRVAIFLSCNILALWRNLRDALSKRCVYWHNRHQHSNHDMPWWNGGMVVMGVYLLASGLVKLKFTTIFKAMAIFGGLCSLALIMNIIYHATGETATFNMFFISPYLPCTLPLLSVIYNLVPYPIFLIIYLLGFSLAGFIMLAIAIMFDRFIKNETERRGVFEDDKAFKIIMRAIKEN